VVKPADVEALKQLALLGALSDQVELASGEFADLIEVSQQTGSRRLIELTSQDLIQREMGTRKQRIQITEAGKNVLRDEYMLYQRLFEVQNTLAMEGQVEAGLGEGRYYLSRPGYESQFEACLGWKPYPGTLNLALSGAEANKLKFLKKQPVFIIEGFQAEGRTFGGVICHPAIVNGVECAAIVPNRTHYTTKLELIAPICLRDTLPTVDGEMLQVSINMECA
jgi:riboflavin kinase